MTLGYIQLNAKIHGVNSVASVTALMDSGAGWNYIRRRLDRNRNIYSIGVSGYRQAVRSYLADGTPVDGEVVEFPKVTIQGRDDGPMSFVVLDRLRAEAIIGARTMQSLRLSLHPYAHSVRFE